MSTATIISNTELVLKILRDIRSIRAILDTQEKKLKVEMFMSSEKLVVCHIRLKGDNLEINPCFA